MIDMEGRRAVAESNEEFSTKLYDVTRNMRGNLVMSPYRASCVMAMLNTATGGNTKQQINSVFCFPPSSSLQEGYQSIIQLLRSTEHIKLESANSVFAMSGFLLMPDVKSLLSSHFHCDMIEVDFGNSENAAIVINSLVKEKTRDNIESIVDARMLNQACMVLVSAIYYKGYWEHKFEPELTEEKEFHVDPSKSLLTPMMKNVNKFYWANLETINSTMVELPYQGDRVFMQVLLPNKKNGLAELEDKLSGRNDVNKMFNESKRMTKLNIELPKFKIEQSIDLEKPFMDMGLVNMFDSSIAEFPGIRGTVFVSRVLQKVFIEVTEEGTEAAAVTAVVCSITLPRPVSPEQFVADHPFIFYLRDRASNMLLFQGRVLNPSQK